MKNFCFDIDGTICTNTYGEYDKAIPYKKRIEKINSLFKNGHTVNYLTARGMGSCNGDAEAANKKYYEYTFRQLVKWGCKFNNLYLGKPKADLYIDDKCINDENFFKNL